MRIIRDKSPKNNKYITIMSKIFHCAFRWREAKDLLWIEKHGCYKSMQQEINRSTPNHFLPIGL